MQIFHPLYSRVMLWAQHKHASWYLGGLSFAESSFFPIPPDVMLAPMALAAPKKAWKFALITTLASTLGGVFGYLIGVWGFDFIEPWLRESRYFAAFNTANAWFIEWGVWVVFIAGFSPIPYKVFTIAAGVGGMALLPFIIASLIGRGLRFFLVAAVMAWGGEKMEKVLAKYIELLGWAVVIAALIVYLTLR